MDNPVSKVAGWGLLLLATARATRFITSDMLGEWTVVGPLKRWAARREVPADLRADLERRLDHERERDEPTANPPQKWGWRSKMVKGLDCPFCVGFWIGGVILLGEATIGRSPLRPLWRFGIAMLGLNYLVGHISSRIDG
ncbi:hypothetical protein QDA11_gp17 [Microbacterium phage Jayden]|uniref:DUF1360 domain-containing protein n=1 Tax=Microbacterium phage Jayden TaxID=2656550 RepID=A0A649VRU0_9CAUD|nr:hypothetical protein QDA11_gp17 [Microbacterium phage Jayden]QGJ95237.1 hypothetical protein PBI_JAYDEN_17 [Microbacterium phage Jayden]